MRTKFGMRMKEFRIENGLTLRKFCRLAEVDASNWSKIERGLLLPPDEDSLRDLLKKLGLEAGSAAVTEILDIAQIQRRQIPSDISEDERMMEMLPAFFRTARNEKPTTEDVETLLTFLRNQLHGPTAQSSLSEPTAD